MGNFWRALALILVIFLLTTGCTRSRPQEKAILGFPSMPLVTHFKEDLKPVAGYEVPANRHERITRRPASSRATARVASAKKAVRKPASPKSPSKARRSKGLAPQRRTSGTVGAAPQLAKE